MAVLTWRPFVPSGGLLRRLAPILALLLATRSASGAEIALVGSFDPYATDAEQRALRDALAAVVRDAGHTPVTLRDMGDTLALHADDVLREALLETVDDAVRVGRALVEQGQYAAAEAVFDEAIEAIEAVAPIVPAPDLAARAWAWRAASRLGRGDLLGARDALGPAVAAAPDGLPADPDWPRDLVGLYEDERALRFRGRATLEVTAETRRATVRLDGRPLGALPLTVDAVLPGPHHVHVRSADGRVGHARFEVPPGDIVEIDVALAAPSLGMVAPTYGERAQRLRSFVSALGDVVGVDVVVVVGRLEDGRVVAQLHDTRTDAFGPAVQGEDPAALVDALMPTVDAIVVRDPLPIDPSTNLALATALRLPPAPGLVRVDPMDPDLSPPRRGEAIRWVGVGLGTAAAIAIGVTLGLVLGGSAATEPTGTITLTPRTR